MKASLLTVGSEITSGQILNGNARDIAQNLQKLGFECCLHLSVPDERPLILEALKICAQKSDLIFVTGGLGPTSDDFTRDLISQWSQSPMEFHEPSWIKVQRRLIERGLVVHEFQKQQCFFPKGAVVLDNTQGTANGFYLETQNKKLWALPGPPNEIKALWIDFVEAQLLKLGIDPVLKRSWHVMGIGENQLAHIAEPLVKDLNLTVGYRVHQPYVELKLNYLKSQSVELESLFDRVNHALSPYTIYRDEESVSLKFCLLMQKSRHTWIWDEVTDGRWLGQLKSYLNSHLSKTDFSYSKNKLMNLEADFFIHLKTLSDNQVLLTARFNEIDFQKNLTSPLTSSAFKDRRYLYFSELAMAELSKRFSVV
ncbi:MAG: competence/damage-inducible protein A [Bdellovibrionales bacterium]